MPDVVDTLRATFAQDLEAAKAKQALIEVLAYCRSMLEAQGFRPDLVDEDGLLILSVDPEIREVAPLALPAPTYVGIDLARPEPEAQDPETPIAPEPEPAPPAAPKPEKKTGPWSDSEKGLALRMAQAGRSTSEIAQALGRAAPGVVNKVKFLLRREREAATARKAPSQPAPISGPMPGGMPKIPAANFEVATKLANSTPFEDLTAEEKVHDRRVAALGYPKPWTPEADLVLVSELAQGRKLASISARLKIDPDLARQRFRALLPDPTWERQKQMLTVLRARAAKAA